MYQESPLLLNLVLESNYLLNIWFLDEDNFGYARDAQGNTVAITYAGQHTRLGMWGGNWNFQAAENIDGRNSVIWKEEFGNGDYYLWLSLHDENWAYNGDGNAGCADD